MEILEILETPRTLTPKKKGPPTKYPFGDIKPGCSLKLGNCSVSDLQRVRSALYQFKKNNRLDWETTVRMVENSIFVSRY